MFNNLFNYDNSFWQFMGKVADIIILNILFILTSLPIFTIGASITSVYYCCGKIVRESDNGTISMYFRSFKDNFKDATIIWLILLLIASILSFDIWFFAFSGYFGSGIIKTIFLSFAFIMLIIWKFIELYIFPLIGRYENTLKNHFLNAYIISFKYLGRTIIMIFINLLIPSLAILSFYVFPGSTVIFIMTGFPLIAYINSYIFRSIFDKIEDTKSMNKKSIEDLD